jgi:hypothetical protein
MASSGVGYLTRWSVPPSRYWTCHVMVLIVGEANKIGNRWILLNPFGRTLPPASFAVPQKADVAPAVHISIRLCENSDAKPSNPIFAQFLGGA